MSQTQVFSKSTIKKRRVKFSPVLKDATAHLQQKIYRLSCDNDKEYTPHPLVVFC